MLSENIIFVEIVTLCFVALVIRLLPHLIAPHGLGVDHWFWKSYVEKYRSEKVFPPRLPQFLLDGEQWYPPVFPLLLVQFPRVIFDYFNHILAILIDLFRLVLLLVTVWGLTGNTTAIAVAGISYAITPVLVFYNVQLNPRGLGALLLDAAIVLMIFSQTNFFVGEWLFWGAVILLGVVLLTHKMTAQLFWFLALAAFALTLDGEFLLLIVLSIVIAMLLSKGFYWKVLLAHRDIVSFWNRNWHLLAAHPVRESPLYGDEGYVTPTKYHRRGVKGWIRRGVYVVGFNPWSWASLILAVIWGLRGWTPGSVEGMLTGWLGIILLFSVLTTVVPFMKCLGNGYLYLYNAAFPASLSWGLWFGDRQANDKAELVLVFVFTAFVSVAGLLFYFHTLRKSKTLKVDADMESMLVFLRTQPEGVVMCLPQHWHDLVAYSTGKSVFFGGHGMGFKLIEPIFPVFRQPVEKIIEQNQIRYLLTYQGYLPANFLADLPPAVCHEFGEYQVHVFV